MKDIGGLQQPPIFGIFCIYKKYFEFQSTLLYIYMFCLCIILVYIGSMFGCCVGIYLVVVVFLYLWVVLYYFAAYNNYLRKFNLHLG